MNVLNGSVWAVYFALFAVESAVASFAWSNGATFVFAAGSARTNSFPPLTDFRYATWVVPVTHVTLP